VPVVALAFCSPFSLFFASTPDAVNVMQSIAKNIGAFIACGELMSIPSASPLCKETDDDPD
jgi:hypothetical protein